MVHLHDGILGSKKKKELIPFATAWMELESIMLSEIRQAAKDKYHMISPISVTQSTKQTNKQKISRVIEIKDKLTVTRGRRKGDKGGGKWRNVIKEHV